MTKQISDTIIYKGEEYFLEDELLANYLFEKNISPPATMTALWRGYLACFEIRDNELFLNDLDLISDEGRELFIKVFPSGFPQKLSFMTRLIVIYDGSYEGNPRLPAELNIWERYYVLEITNGNLTGAKTFDHAEMESFKEEQYQYYLLTDEYAAKKLACIEEEKAIARKNHTGISKRAKFKFDEETFNQNIKKRILIETTQFF
ncbi:hypothetical protein HYN59_04800 [Flavobacterium album]|uniref:Uncharacterized protein n=1 Tax=Flavobacterium album TaxID=2175091 RepID=A0A2S1QVQ5_9FLAO|nr:hypothetical protein [Flavobacterium album]AWH84478.1 hypothetical protein HYN59_04800 [Flavobacterium album]